MIALYQRDDIKQEPNRNNNINRKSYALTSCLVTHFQHFEYGHNK